MPRISPAQAGLRHCVSHHELFGDFFTARGLDYLVSRSSCHGDSHSLVVIARPDVIDGIMMPSSEDMSDPAYSKWPVPDWEMQEALRLASEGVLRNRQARQTRDEEDGGDLAMALRLYCDTAYADWTGGFHHLAREMPGVASPAQGFQRPTGSRVARSHLQETRSRFLSPFPSRRRNPRRSRRRVRGNRRPFGP